MKMYGIEFAQEIHHYIQIEASSLEEARSKAEEMIDNGEVSFDFDDICETESEISVIYCEEEIR